MKDLFTSEGVTAGHPDKVCDIISDAILDNALTQDPDSKVAIEVTIKNDFILIYGEINSKAQIEYEKIARDMIHQIGYTENYQITTKIDKQSPEINNAVVNQKDNTICAGDQGIMFGYACDETNTYMPAPIWFANKLAYQLSLVQKKYDELRPDGKTQVSVEYLNGHVKRIDSIVISTQHTKNISQQEIKNIILREVINKTINRSLLDDKTKYFINPSGSFILGGSFGDSGTTGRKIVCDTYGGMGRIGGGCLSSKDPSKVDRSGAYYSRYVAKNIVANKLANRCEIQVAYSIGEKYPVSLNIDTFGTEKVPLSMIYDYVENNYNFEVNNIINELNLKRPIYLKTSCYGHFGRSEFPWEKVNPIE